MVFEFHPDGINGKITLHPSTICRTYGVNGAGPSEIRCAYVKYASLSLP